LAFSFNNLMAALALPPVANIGSSTITSASATFRVTAPQDQIQGVKRGFAALLVAQEALCKAAAEFDRRGMSTDAGKEEARAILSDLQNDMASLSAYTGSEPMLMDMLNVYHSAVTAIEELIESNYQSDIAFSSKLKYTQLYITHEYVKLMDRLA